MLYSLRVRAPCRACVLVRLSLSVRHVYVPWLAGVHVSMYVMCVSCDLVLVQVCASALVCHCSGAGVSQHVRAHVCACCVLVSKWMAGFPTLVDYLHVYVCMAVARFEARGLPSEYSEVALVLQVSGFQRLTLIVCIDACGAMPAMRGACSVRACMLRAAKEVACLVCSLVRLYKSYRVRCP